MANNEEYEIGIIENESDAHLCAKLIAQEFALHNPLSVYDQLTAEQLFDEWLWPLILDVFNQKLSFFVRHRSTNQFVAAIIASDLFLYCKKHPYDPSGPASNIPSADLFDEMRDRFVTHDLGQELKPNMVLCISAGATRIEHAGKGVASQLRSRLLDYARDTKGFQYAFIQTTNAATRHIYIKKMNGQEKTILDPATWIWKKGDGVTCPAKDYKGEPVVNILVKF